MEYAAANQQRRQRLASRSAAVLLVLALIATALVWATPRSARARLGREEVPPGSGSHSLEFQGKAAPRAPQYLKIPKGTCKEFGWRTISSTGNCEFAASELNLQATEAKEMRLPEWPDGCHYYQNFAAEGAEMLFVNHNPLGSDVEREDEIARMGLRETLCEAPHSGSSSTRELVLAPLSPAEQGATAATFSVPSTTTEQPLAAVPDQEVRCSFVVGNIGDDTCPEGSVPLIESECRKMPYHFGGILHAPFEEDSAEDPAGCFFFSPMYYYNIHPLGSKRMSRTPYCKRCAVKSLNDETGDWSDWGGGQAPRVSSRYRKIEIGKCADISWHPIHRQAACQEAALELGLGNLDATVTTFQERPEGCYYFRNYQDGTATLWINFNPYSAGNGAETSNLIKGMLRQPICRLHRGRSTTQLPAGASGGVVEMPFNRDLANRALPTTTILTTTFKPGQFRKLKDGACKDVDMDPVNDQVSCERAAREIGLIDTVPQLVTPGAANRPEGCYYFRNGKDLTASLWLNPNPSCKGLGAETSDISDGLIREPVCQQRQVQEPVATSSRFKMIRTGRCADLGLRPINEAGVCETAARELSLVRGEGPGSGPLKNGAPIVASLTVSPEGCYYFWNSQDGTATLWLNSNPASKGNGAESSDPSKGLLRQPLCMSSRSPDGPGPQGREDPPLLAPAPVPMPAPMPAPVPPQTTSAPAVVPALPTAARGGNLAVLQNSMAAAATAAASSWTTQASKLPLSRPVGGETMI
jgi:hypothetical protein